MQRGVVDEIVEQIIESVAKPAGYKVNGVIRGTVDDDSSDDHQTVCVDAKMVEFHSSDFEQKMLRCYGPAFQSEDTAIIHSTVSSF
jgi:hypothetical protein